MTEWSWPEFMSNRSMASNQATKPKLHGRVHVAQQSKYWHCATSNCLHILSRHHIQEATVSWCPPLLVRQSFEDRLSPFISYSWWLSDQSQSSHPIGAQHPTKPQQSCTVGFILSYKLTSTLSWLLSTSTSCPESKSVSSVSCIPLVCLGQSSHPIGSWNKPKP